MLNVQGHEFTVGPDKRDYRQLALGQISTFRNDFSGVGSSVRLRAIEVEFDRSLNLLASGIYWESPLLYCLRYHSSQ
jgi:hypothetical protein